MNVKSSATRSEEEEEEEEDLARPHTLQNFPLTNLLQHIIGMLAFSLRTNPPHSPQ